MMTPFEFLKYVPTPGEKHLGICTVRLYGKVILRYKIIATKDGTSFFPAAASYKLPSTDGQDHYTPAFMLDSQCDKEELDELIKANVRDAMNAQPVAQKSYTPKTQYQPASAVFPDNNDNIPF